jgi:hypothetical protein
MASNLSDRQRVRMADKRGKGDRESGRKGKWQSFWATGKGYRVADKGNGRQGV